MIKEVQCPICQGYGFNSKFNEKSIWSEKCQNCDGTGIVKAPMTNADRIRAMSDEELAEELVIEIEGLFPSLVYVPMATGNIYISRDKAEKEMLEYLQQPAEEET